MLCLSSNPTPALPSTPRGGARHPPARDGGDAAPHRPRVVQVARDKLQEELLPASGGHGVAAAAAVLSHDVVHHRQRGARRQRAQLPGGGAAHAHHLHRAMPGGTAGQAVEAGWQAAQGRGPSGTPAPGSGVQPASPPRALGPEKRLGRRRGGAAPARCGPLAAPPGLTPAATSSLAPRRGPARRRP